MEYKIYRETAFSPVTVKLILETPSELLWFTAAMNLGPAKILNMRGNERYKEGSTMIDKSDLWRHLDDICQIYNLIPSKEPHL